MRIVFRKIDDERHELALARADGRGLWVWDAVECETRSLLVHDFLHYAVESEAGLRGGFWGNLAAGKTLAQMNDRSGAGMADVAEEMQAIEQVVGALHPAAKGAPAGSIVSGVRGFCEQLGVPPPAWLTEELVERVQERMRRLLGQWRATPYGGRMELSFPWPPPGEPFENRAR